MIIPSRNGIECIEDHTLEVTFRESFMTYYESDTRKALSCLQVAFNNTSAISWWSVLLVEQTEVTRENHQPVVSH
jgi:hypothetical protein